MSVAVVHALEHGGLQETVLVLHERKVHPPAAAGGRKLQYLEKTGGPGTGAVRQRYLLRVVGPSMTGAGIGDGDLLVPGEDEDPAEGEIGVALLAGGQEVTVKHLYRERSSEGETETESW